MNRRIFLLVSLSLGGLSTVVQAAQRPFFSKEIRALLEPCAQFLMREPLQFPLEKVGTDSDAVEKLRSRLETRELSERFRVTPQIGVALFLVDEQERLLPRMDQGEITFSTLNASLEFLVKPHDTVFGTVRREAQGVLPFTELNHLRLLGVSFSHWREQPYFVFHIAADALERQGEFPEIVKHSAEQEAIEYLRLESGRLTPTIVHAARVFERGQREAGDVFLAKLTRIEIAAMRRVLRDLAEIEKLLDNLPQNSSDAIEKLGQVRENAGYSLMRRSLNGRQELLLTRTRDHWNWKVGELVDANFQQDSKRPASVRRFLHVSTNGSVNDIREALKALGPFFPRRTP